MAVGVIVVGDISAIGAVLGADGLTGTAGIIAAGIAAAPGDAGIVDHATDRNPAGIAADTDAAGIERRRAACISVAIISAGAAAAGGKGRALHRRLRLVR